MKKRLELYLPVLNILGLIASLWILSEINVTPAGNTNIASDSIPDSIHNNFHTIQQHSNAHLSSHKTSEKITKALVKF